MARRNQDIAVTGLDGFAFPEIRGGETTQIGVGLELKGDTVTADTHACTLVRGDTSVVIASTAVLGEVTAEVTAANLTTLGATIGTGLSAFFDGTATADGQTYTWRFKMSLAVEDRLFRNTVLMSELHVVLPSMARACSVPGNETNWSKTAKFACWWLRSKIEATQGLRMYLLDYPDDVKRMQVFAVLYWVAKTMGTQANGQDGDIASRAAEFMQELNDALADTAARFKATSVDWKSGNGSTKALQVTPANTATGVGANGGWGVL